MQCNGLEIKTSYCRHNVLQSRYNSSDGSNVVARVSEVLELKEQELVLLPRLKQSEVLLPMVGEGGLAVT